MEYTIEANISRRSNSSRFLSLNENEVSLETSDSEIDIQNNVLKDQNRKEEFSSSTPAISKPKKKPHKTLNLSAILLSPRVDSGATNVRENTKPKTLSLRAKAAIKATKNLIPKTSESQNLNENNQRDTDKHVEVSNTKNVVSKEKESEVRSQSHFKLPNDVKSKEPAKKQSNGKELNDKRSSDREPKKHQLVNDMEKETNNKMKDDVTSVKKVRSSKNIVKVAGPYSSGYESNTHADTPSEISSVSSKRKLYFATNTLLMPPENGELNEVPLVDEPTVLPKSKNRKRKSSSPKKRLKPGVLVLKEIKKYQKSTDLLLAKAPFSRVIREIAQNYGRSDIRWTGSALMALQEATEAYLVTVFEQAYMITRHAKRVTLMASDMRLLNRLRS